MRKFLEYIRANRTERYLLIALCALVLFPMIMDEIVGENGYLARRRRRSQIEALSADLERLKQENAQLSEKIRALRSDPDTIEKLARERLNLGRPGDVVVTLPPPVSPPAATSK